jgi:hypothetical protein
MTRKLTDEQVKAIKDLFVEAKKYMFCNHYFVNCGILNEDKGLDVRVYGTNDLTTYQVSVGVGRDDVIVGASFQTPNEAIAYVEHLLNQRYCWLPQNNGWIMSGVVYNFANNGANKVLELAHLASLNGWSDLGDYWYSNTNISRSDAKMTESIECIGGIVCSELVEGITIDKDSPIWDAVKGLE